MLVFLALSQSSCFKVWLSDWSVSWDSVGSFSFFGFFSLDTFQYVYRGFSLCERMQTVLWWSDFSLRVHRDLCYFSVCFSFCCFVLCPPCPLRNYSFLLTKKSWTGGRKIPISVPNSWLKKQAEIKSAYERKRQQKGSPSASFHSDSHV